MAISIMATKNVELGLQLILPTLVRIMAESLLYGNLNEPEFPFEAIRPYLTWLPSYLDARITSCEDELETFINTILVFGRARTATLQGQFWWTALREFINRLNASLKLAGGSAFKHHKMELALRGRSMFVTCANNRRFLRKKDLTHRDVGCVLDFFAPGNNGSLPGLGVHFVETTSMWVIMSEKVLVETLNDPAIRDEFESFNKRREALYNSTMEKLGLRYRFKCLIVSDTYLESASVSEIMLTPQPPSKIWWDNKCLLVNGYPNTRSNTFLSCRFAFCDYDTLFEMYWPVLQIMFGFLMKYCVDSFWLTSEETGVEFWRAVQLLCRTVRVECKRQRCKEDIEAFCEHVKREVASLKNQADSPVKTPYLGKSRPFVPDRFKNRPFRLQRLWVKFQMNLSSTKETVRFLCSPTSPLMRAVPEYPALGDQPALSQHVSRRQ